MNNESKRQQHFETRQVNRRRSTVHHIKINTDSSNADGLFSKRSWSASSGIGKIFDQFLTAINWQATATGEKTSMKDDVRKENEQLCMELDNLGREHKKLKQIVDQLSTDYEASKAYDPLRRYEKLKGMVKRTIMHLKLNPDEPNTIQGVGVGGLMQGCRDISHNAESARRREDKYSKMSRQELQQENVHLQTQVREMRRKCAIICDVIDNLQKTFRRFETSPRHSALQHAKGYGENCNT